MIRRHWPLVLILILFLGLGLVYSVVNPLFESPDEVWHYEYVRWLVEGNGLPRPEQVGDAPWHQEGSQPPLYYLMAAGLTRPISTDNAEQVIRYNPHAAVGQPDSFGNKNVLVHGSPDAWPWTGVALAAHVSRLFSLLLAAMTVLAAYGTTLAIFPRWKAVAAVAASLVAFNPQFIFLSAAVNNDNLVIAASSAGLWLMVYLLGRKDEAPPGTALQVTTAMRTATATVRGSGNGGQGTALRRQAAPSAAHLVLLGALIGVAALSKLSGLALAGLAGLTLLILAVRRGSLRELIRWGLVVAVVALAVAGWWYWRNWQLYGDPLGLQAMFDILPRRAEPPTAGELIARAQGIWRSAWAVFGWFNVTVPEWVYTIYTAVALAGLAGLLVAWPVRWALGKAQATGNQRPVINNTGHAATLNLPSDYQTTRLRDHETTRPPDYPQLVQLLLLAIWCTIVLLALLNWARMRYPQGRLLFPAITAAAVLISIGLAAWLPRRLRVTVAVILGGGLFVLALIVPFRWIGPAYAAPSLLSPDVGLPNAVDAAFGDQIRLHGYDLDVSELRPGDSLPLTLYWQALQPLDTDYSVFVHLTDENDILQAQQDSYPAGGSLPTSDWPADRVIPDRHVVSVPETAPAPHRLKIDVGVYDYASGQRLLVGGQDHWTVGYVTLLPLADEGDSPNPVHINFDDQIALVGFDFDRRIMQPGDSLGLTLWWEALDAPKMDYVVFTHLVFPPDAVWAGRDQMPQAGQAPTSRWQPGQRVEDRYKLTLPEEAPPGVYFVEIGLYDPDTNDRLKVEFSDKGIVLGQVKVEPGE